MSEVGFLETSVWNYKKRLYSRSVCAQVGAPDLVLAFSGSVPSVPQVPSNKYCLKDLGGKGSSYKECIKSFVSGLSESCVQYPLRLPDARHITG